MRVGHSIVQQLDARYAAAYQSCPHFLTSASTLLPESRVAAAHPTAATACTQCGACGPLATGWAWDCMSHASIHQACWQHTQSLQPGQGAQWRVQLLPQTHHSRGCQNPPNSSRWVPAGCIVSLHAAGPSVGNAGTSKHSRALQGLQYVRMQKSAGNHN